MKSGINRAFSRIKQGFPSRSLRLNIQGTRSIFLLLKRCPAHHMIISASDQSFTRHPLASFTTSNGETKMDENKFLELAEYALEDIIDWIDGIEEMLDETDISLSVCTISNS
jgi:hypothetical protein